MYLITLKTGKKLLGFLADSNLDAKLKELKNIYKDWKTIEISKNYECSNARND